MIVLTQELDSLLTLKADYYYRERLKEIPYSFFDFDHKVWCCPISSLPYIESNFSGELVYKTPKWVLHHEPMPDMTKMYQLTRQIQLPAFKIEPFAHQKYAIQFMVNKLLDQGFVINADDVGIGKTLTGIGTIKWMFENKGIKRVLLIVKKSIKTQWKEEIETFTDLAEQGVVISTTMDAKKKREQAYDSIKQASRGILITNYHNFLNDTELIRSIGFDMVLIDECHKIATRTGRINNSIAKACKKLPTIFLTGTPIMTNPENIFSILQIAKPGFFGPWKDFKKRYIVEDHNYMYSHVVGAKNLDELREKVQSVIIRRTMEEVSISMPTTTLKQIKCEPDAVQRKIMKEIKTKLSEYSMKFEECMEAYKQTKNPGLKEQMERLQAISKGMIASQQAVANDPRMFLMSRSKLMKQTFGALVPPNYTMSSKTEAILDTIEEIMDSGEKVILFSKFKTTVNLLCSDIAKRFSIQPCRYTGDESDDEREANLKRFKTDPSAFVLCMTEAGAEGLNIAHARHCINIDQPDSLAIKTQRIGRIRRASSKYQTVHAYDFITEESMDVSKLEKLSNNANITDALVSVNEAQSKALVQEMKKLEVS